tara:strand:- start:101 stop:337 length:237 start_codon:yes stop_codon:yes gene_type:complete
MASGVCSRSGIKVNGMVTKGKAHKKIVDIADLVGAKLIVMRINVTPLSFSEKIIGSKAIRFASKSPCPITTIKGQKHL